MSDEKLKEYKALYSEYTTHLVKMYNYHQVFLNQLGRDSSKNMRNCIREMIRIERKLQVASWESYKESVQNKRDELVRLKKERRDTLAASRQARAGKVGRPKKEKSNDNN
jgi:hypothetical protein